MQGQHRPLAGPEGVVSVRANPGNLVITLASASKQREATDAANNDCGGAGPGQPAGAEV